MLPRTVKVIYDDGDYFLLESMQMNKLSVVTTP